MSIVALYEYRNARSRFFEIVSIFFCFCSVLLCARLNIFLWVMTWAQQHSRRRKCNSFLWLWNSLFSCGDSHEFISWWYCCSTSFDLFYLWFFALEICWKKKCYFQKHSKWLLLIGRSLHSFLLQFSEQDRFPRQVNSLWKVCPFGKPIRFSCAQLNWTEHKNVWNERLIVKPSATW